MPGGHTECSYLRASANIFHHERIFPADPREFSTTAIQLKCPKCEQPNLRAIWILKFMRIIYLIHPFTATAALELTGSIFSIALPTGGYLEKCPGCELEIDNPRLGWG